MKIVVFLAGLFSICGGVFNWDFFFRNYRAAPLVRLLGREGARKFYIGLGVFLVIAGFFV